MHCAHMALSQWMLPKLVVLSLVSGLTDHIDVGYSAESLDESMPTSLHSEPSAA